MLTVIQKYIKDNRGQTLVEFALVVALLLAILFGIVEFGRAMFYSNHLTNTVRSAARYAAVLGDMSRSAFDSAVEDYVEQEIGFSMNTDDIEDVVITATAPDGTVRGNNDAVQSGDTITVTVGYNFTVLSGQILSYFGGGSTVVGDIVIERSASMQFE